MVFTSHAFVFYFLPLTLAFYYALPQRGRAPFLTLASYLFYGWWSPWFVLLMLASTVVDYLCGKVVVATGASARRRRSAVAISVAANLGLLGIFKYGGFATRNLNAVLGPLGLSSVPVLDLVLPVGISFYTFQSMSYTIDLYRRQARPARSFLDFATYVSLFPQLIAGPIIRYRDIAEQLRERRHTAELVASGFAMFAFGFAKKVLLANNLGPVADAVFAADAPPWHVAWIGVLAYAFQIYFDFSGYSDMAIGLGRMLGFRFPRNFDAPYRAESITDFWRRWHISLSSWLRDYLYIPLGGNRRGRLLTYRNLALTMVLGGLWHGAEWKFVIWGALHGALLACERLLGRRPLYGALPRPLRIAITFAIVLVTWVFFRAASLGEAVAMLGSMFGVAPATDASSLVAGAVYSDLALVVLGIAALAVWLGRRTEEWVDGAAFLGPVSGEDGAAPRLSPGLALTSLGLLVLGVLEMSVQSHNPFLYFQF